MKIKRYIVSNKKIFVDSLEEELCKKNISYVKIGNEIHFLNQIIFFYDLVLDLQLIISLFFNNLIVDKQIIFNTQATFDIQSKIDSEKFLIDIKNIDNLQLQSNLTYQKINKKINKTESNCAKQKIKKYQNSNNKFFARKI